MLYSVYHGLIYAVSSDRPATESNDGSIIGKGEHSDNLWFCSGRLRPLYPAFISGLSNEELDAYNYKIFHSELLPECPYAWAVFKKPDSYWAGEKKTRLFVAAPDEEADYLTSVGAVKISGEEKNEAAVSLWYYSSDDPDLPEHFSKYPYIWQDLFTEDDFFYPEDFDEEDEFTEDA